MIMNMKSKILLEDGTLKNVKGEEIENILLSNEKTDELPFPYSLFKGIFK